MAKGNLLMTFFLEVTSLKEKDFRSSNALMTLVISRVEAFVVLWLLAGFC